MLYQYACINSACLYFNLIYFAEYSSIVWTYYSLPIHQLMDIELFLVFYYD